MQMGIALTFAILYAVAPKTFNPDVTFAPVPWALSAYFGFTALRLALAYRRPLPGWLLALSIIVDMSLLFGLIWSFHIQYAQPPAFYLKAPTVLYVFIFIALRALRFEARFVLLGGVVAALGWLAMVIYAAGFDPSGMPVTRDYVAYMTAPLILWGAEIDKIMSILLVTVLLAVALIRARRMLMRAVAQETAAKDLGRFFSPEVARRITAAEERIRPGQGEMRDAATLFIDIRSFTRLSKQLEPSALVALLSEYQSRMVSAVQANGGSIDKFLGDGIMASFGAARPNSRYALDALRAVESVMSEADIWRQERRARGLPTIEIGAAVAAGPVLFGAIGDETRLEYTVIGEAVNLAAKLEKHTKAERVHALTTVQALALARSQGYSPVQPLEMRPGRKVDGVEAHVDLVVLRS